MEIYSKKIESHVLHFAQPSNGRALEGWGIDGISEMLEEIAEGPYGYDFLNIDIVVAFYKHIEPYMLSGDEVWTDLEENDLKNIRFVTGGALQSYPNLFLYHES
ncbi:hypothetical protein GFB56_15530 [Ensifer sp. T173]|uniref:Uncharacterized protein n=1 Tax=Ensifer canadensis TaxID=555315 RepID=A0AAW4FJK6_9HYPH|nr:hypothetical protein [Ensifer canadensis]MBM3092217.1 hypothetical protein [Ensifer canadensis]UBI73942.1 hypothetical protein J3R84_10420 [Ensifer canadensis]